MIPIFVNPTIHTLLEQLEITLEPSDAEIEMQWHIEPAQLDIDAAIPLGLVVSELVNNAYKHAFKNAATGTIDIAFNADGNRYTLKVVDNGNGTVLGSDGNTDSFGMRLINTLVGSLNGQLEWAHNNGTQATITFAGA